MFAIRNNAGLSLIELLVTLTIIIILTMTAVPSFLTLYREHQLTSNIQNLHYTLQFARSSAIKSNQTVYVHFKTGNNWCYGANLGTSCDCSAANSCTLSHFQFTNQALSLSTSGLASNTLSFESTRGATNKNSRITFSLSGKSTAVSLNVSALGNMQYCSSTLDGYATC